MSSDQVGVEGPTVDLIAQAVLRVEGVHDLHAGVLGEVATYLPGRRVNGVRLREPGCDIHVILDWGAPVTDTTDRVRSALRRWVSGAIDVTVEDVAAPGVPVP